MIIPHPQCVAKYLTQMDRKELAKNTVHYLICDKTNCKNSENLWIMRE